MGFCFSAFSMALAMMGLIILQLSSFTPHISAKVCNNGGMASHTLRYEMLMSKNETWKNEMLSHHHHHHVHVTPTDESTWAGLFPRKMLMEESEKLSWNMVYRKMKHPAQFKMDGDFLKDVSLHNVRLSPDSLHWRAQQTNLEYLLMLDVDRLVWSFRQTAGLQTPNTPYGGWEAPSCELRGHFVGHYLSATAQMWASTHNDTLKKKMDYLVAALNECQGKMGTGYLSAFPPEFFDRFEALQPVWAPYYTIHKIMAGLLDQYTLAGNSEALKMINKMADYFYNRVQNVIATATIERHWLSLNEEVGGMNDVLYRLYGITRNEKHLLLAHLFDKPCFLGILAMKADDIAGFHSNSHIPLVIGAQMRYEVTGDELYREIGTFFMDIVNATHSYATGGTSINEFWSDPKRLGGDLSTENEESCTTYNMLKVSRNVFRWTKEVKYADHYERALTNGVLSIQRGTDPGVMIYMLPLGHGVSKARSYHHWGTPDNDFWCCYGTGIESFSKLGDSIYFEEGGKSPGLYVIQYISSSLDWESGKISLTQQVKPVVSMDQTLHVMLTVSTKEGSGTSSLNLRIPSWTTLNGASASLNGEKLQLPNPGQFLSVNRNWKNGDKIVLELPLTLRTEVIEDDRQGFNNLHAIIYGPYLLAGLSDGDFEIKVGSGKPVSEWVTPVPPSSNSNLISLFQEEGLHVSTNTDHSIKMGTSPLHDGNGSSVRTTFRMIFKDSPSSPDPKEPMGHVIMLEPFDHPGMVVAHNGAEQGLTIANKGGSSEFRVVKGLNGKEGSISLQSISQEGCFVSSGGSGSRLTLSCKAKKNGGFEEEASFKLMKENREYNPISFVAKGEGKSFLLEPLLSLKDENYNVYFSIV